MNCCFNPKLLLAAGAIAVGIFFVAPNAALPVAVALIAFACPVSMFLAMRRSQRGDSYATDTSGRDPKIDEQTHALRTEIEQLRRRQRENK